MNGKVSVIIPAYNAEKYLTECIDSVLAQTYKNVELIIVNDGSIDGTKAILESYQQKHANIQVIHTDNGGVSRARNVGLDNATGEWIMFLDSDDLLVANAIEILLNDIKDKGADLAVGMMSADVNSQPISCESTEVSVWRGTDGVEKALEDNPATYSSCAKLFKRQALEHVRFVEGKKVHEDSFFMFSVFTYQPTVVVRNAYIYKYRVNENSSSHAAFSDKFFDILYFAKEKLNIIETQFPEFVDKAKNMWVKANIAMLQCLLNTSDKRYKKDIKNCIREVKKYKKYFIPMYHGDEKRFKIIVCDLYGVFKFLYRIKYAKRLKRRKG